MSETPMLNSGIIQLHGGSIIVPYLWVTPGTLTGWGTVDGDIDLLHYAPVVALPAIPVANTAALLFTIGGTTPDTRYDSIALNGTITLGGALEIQFANGFQNQILPTDTFTVLPATSLTSSFLNVADGGRLETLDGYGSFAVNYGTGAYANEIFLSDFQTPEPSMGLMLIGLCAVEMSNRRKRSLSRPGTRPVGGE